MTSVLLFSATLPSAVGIASANELQDKTTQVSKGSSNLMVTGDTLNTTITSTTAQESLDLHQQQVAEVISNYLILKEKLYLQLLYLIC
jgi:hypothetical protein